MLDTNGRTRLRTDLMLLRANLIANEASGNLAPESWLQAHQPPLFSAEGPVNHPTFNRQMVKFSTLGKHNCSANRQ